MVPDDERTEQVALPAAGAEPGTEVLGDLGIPEGARGLVVFAHGSGSSRLSERNRWVAAELRRAGLATLLMDLLTTDEEWQDVRTGHLRFDIDLLTRRVLGATEWVAGDERTSGLAIGLFGASTGAAAALGAAAEHPDRVAAVVSRGGRPDLTPVPPERVRVPTLLIVGSRDHDVVRLNRGVVDRLGGTGNELRLVDGATHLFEEPGALNAVAEHATEWFGRTLT